MILIEDFYSLNYYEYTLNENILPKRSRVETNLMKYTIPAERSFKLINALQEFWQITNIIHNKKMFEFSHSSWNPWIDQAISTYICCICIYFLSLYWFLSAHCANISKISSLFSYLSLLPVSAGLEIIVFVFSLIFCVCGAARCGPGKDLNWTKGNWWLPDCPIMHSHHPPSHPAGSEVCESQWLSYYHQPAYTLPPSPLLTAFFHNILRLGVLWALQSRSAARHCADYTTHSTRPSSETSQHEGWWGGRREAGTQHIQWRFAPNW